MVEPLFMRFIIDRLRKNAEEIDGRVGETFSGIRVVRAFGREKRELIEYMHGCHTVLRRRCSPRVHRRHHGVSVVHVPSPEPGEMVRRQMESHGEGPVVDFEPVRTTI
jgi:ABC-type multidrug transport system fused ATPase/permease subunit